MIRLDGGRFLMGTDSPQAFPADGEGPVREVTLNSFYLDRNPVTNARFEEFVRATGYQTEAERFGWSFVFYQQIPAQEYAHRKADTVRGAEWWCKIDGADWQHPEGPDSSIANREHHPVTHVSWNDAVAYSRMGGQAPSHRGRVGIRRTRRSGAEAFSVGRRSDSRRPTSLQHLARRISDLEHG